MLGMAKFGCLLGGMGTICLFYSFTSFGVNDSNVACARLHSSLTVASLVCSILAIPVAIAKPELRNGGSLRAHVVVFPS